MVSSDRLQALGYTFIIIPSDLQRAAIHACQRTLDAIAQYGDSSSMADSMATFKDREQLIGTPEYLKLIK